MLKLSRRLQAIADMVPQSKTLVDIGSDHAYLPIYLVQQKIIQSALATEVAKGPLGISKKDICAANLADQIQTRLGDGFAALKLTDKFQTVVIAGMGGQLIANILEHGGTYLTDLDQLILEPNNDEWQVRQWLVQHSFQIVAETIVQEGRHVYEIIKAKPGLNTQLTTEQLMFGPFLSQEKSIVFKNKWQQQLKRSKMMYCNLLNAKSPQTNKIIWARERIKRIEEILK